MKTNVKSYRGYRFPPEIISHGVWDLNRDPKLPETDGISVTLTRRINLLAKRRGPPRLVARRPTGS